MIGLPCQQQSIIDIIELAPGGCSTAGLRPVSMVRGARQTMDHSSLSPVPPSHAPGEHLGAVTRDAATAPLFHDKGALP